MKIHAGTETQELMARMWQTAEDHGFHATSNGQTIGDRLMLIVSELSEALEEFRNGHAPDEVYHKMDKRGVPKPEGVPIELADAVIRIFEMSYHEGIDLAHAINLKMDYNDTREYQHGNKRL